MALFVVGFAIALAELLPRSGSTREELPPRRAGGPARHLGGAGAPGRGTVVVYSLAGLAVAARRRRGLARRRGGHGPDLPLRARRLARRRCAARGRALAAGLAVRRRSSPSAQVGSRRQLHRPPRRRPEHRRAPDQLGLAARGHWACGREGDFRVDESGEPLAIVAQPRRARRAGLRGLVVVAPP